MQTHFLDEIDWKRPWLAPLRPFAGLVGSEPNWCGILNDLATRSGLRNHRCLPIRFVPQAELPPGTAYESHISATGCVPTRDNLHDFFNALIWLTFPKIKIRLNALQAAELEKATSLQSQVTTGHPGRGAVRDAATIFDENAALFVVRQAELLDLLRTHEWHRLFVDRRNAFDREAEVWLFGHALMEKLIRPYKAITAHTWAVVADEAFFEWPVQAKRDWLDKTISAQLHRGIDMSAFTPLPVMGIPGWSRDQDDLFYSDKAVFRPRRAR